MEQRTQLSLLLFFSHLIQSDSQCIRTLATYQLDNPTVVQILTDLRNPGHLLICTERDGIHDWNGTHFRQNYDIRQTYSTVRIEGFAQLDKDNFLLGLWNPNCVLKYNRNNDALTGFVGDCWKFDKTIPKTVMPILTNMKYHNDAIYIRNPGLNFAHELYEVQMHLGTTQPMVKRIDPVMSLEPKVSTIEGFSFLHDDIIVSTTEKLTENTENKYTQIWRLSQDADGNWTTNETFKWKEDESVNLGGSAVVVGENQIVNMEHSPGLTWLQTKYSLYIRSFSGELLRSVCSHCPVPPSMHILQQGNDLYFTETPVREYSVLLFKIIDNFSKDLQLTSTISIQRSTTNSHTFSANSIVDDTLTTIRVTQLPQATTTRGTYTSYGQSHNAASNVSAFDASDTTPSTSSGDFPFTTIIIIVAISIIAMLAVMCFFIYFQHRRKLQTMNTPGIGIPTQEIIECENDRGADHEYDQNGDYESISEYEEIPDSNYAISVTCEIEPHENTTKSLPRDQPE